MKTLKLTLLLFFIAQLNLKAQHTRTARLDSFFTALHDKGQLSGNVLIAENGKPIYQKSFGFADSAKKIPNTPQTKFLLASVSKQFTAMGIVLLKEAGKLSLDDELAKYIPELPYPGVTIRQLLNHTSGLPDYDALMNRLWDKTKFATNNDMIDMLVKYHPSVFFSPGQQYSYSNTGYALLAVVIERVSGISFPDYMQAMVFRPLGLTNTLVYTRRARPRQVADIATGYVYADSIKRFILPEEHPIWKNTLWEDGIYGEDGVNTTVGDLLHWDQLVYNRAILKADDWQQVLTAGMPKTGVSDYGFGWHLGNLPGTGHIAYHTGGWPGFIAYNEQGLDRNYTIIVLRNQFFSQIQLKVNAATIRKILELPGN